LQTESKVSTSQKNSENFMYEKIPSDPNANPLWLDCTEN